MQHDQSATEANAQAEPTETPQAGPVETCRTNPGAAGEAADPDEGISPEPPADEQTGEVRVSFAEESPEALKAKTEAIKLLVAERVREDSRERAELTPEVVIVSLHLDLLYGKIAVDTVLSEMSTDERYLDILAITTVTGLLYVYSVSYLPEDEALAKSVIEEAKFILASAIRADSRDLVRLTPLSEIYAMAPDTDPAIIDVLLKGMPLEARYVDIKKATDAGGTEYYHCDIYLTESYAVTLMLAMAGDHLATIAETIREESRIYPRTTNVTIFRDQSVYGVPAGDLDTVLWNLLRNPKYADIKRIVHPVTRAIHLYSDTFISEVSAWAMMDWEEVGRANNP
jgi:hypothetical protein